MSRYIAAYDISDDGRRTSVARVLLQFGDRIQKSVFEVWLDPDELPQLRRRVGPHLGHDDEFELIPIDQDSNRTRWRWGRDPEAYPPVTVLGR